MGLKPNGVVSEPLAARLRAIDWPSGTVVRDFAWTSPVDVMSGPGADQEFTSASLLIQDVILQPTHTEVLWICPVDWVVIHRLTHPLLHNVHSASPVPGGGLLVTCAGSESVLEFDDDDQLIAHHWLREGSFKGAYSGFEDLRRVHHDHFKPHSHHPNHAARVGASTWVTCFETQRAVCIEDGREIVFPEGIPHDGRLIDGLMWFTVVTGHVIAVDPITLERRVDLDLNAMVATERMLGWCRGLDVVGNRLFVGMTVLRATRHREVLRWLAHGQSGQKLPTRILEIDLTSRRIVREVEVGNAAGGTIYSINVRP